MTREEVQARLDAFLALLQREQEVKEELLALKMMGHKATEEALKEKLQRQNDLLAEVERLRHEEMLPILEELASFISEAQQQVREGHV